MNYKFNYSPEKFREAAAGGGILPVYTEMIADIETPVSAMSKLGSEGYAFLLESAETNDHVGRYSFVGFDPEVLFEANGREISVTDSGGTREFTTDATPLDELRKLMANYPVAEPIGPGGPWFSGGAVGYLGYDMVRFFEPTIGSPPEESLGLPDMFFMIGATLLVFDHRFRKLRIIANPITGSEDADAVYQRAVARIRKVIDILAMPSDLRPVDVSISESDPEISSNTTRDEYMAMVEKAKAYIRAGDIFQMVPSQRFETGYPGDALTLYRCLRFVNPSPYMFCLNAGGRFSVVGSSPEVHVRAIDGKVEIRPIAGTRKRGANEEEDIANENDLLADPKERAEHIMLVDLARNDVGRIAEYHSVEVTDLMIIERYSHVMHIVSNVEGRLKPGNDAYDVMRATFPAGTVSGSPKVRAMQIINEMEKSKRGVYAGAVGYFGYDGNLDSCITLRTVVMKDGKAYVQAGGGVVADSTPEGEYQESVNKAMGMMKAIGKANHVYAEATQRRDAK